jgi:hypothetical protein
VRRLIELLPTEVAQLKGRLAVAKFKGKLKGTPADALKHLKKLGKCAAELEMLLLTMPNRIAWVGDVGSGAWGTSYPTGETSILMPAPVEHPRWKFMNFISDLERLQTAAKMAERYLGPSPGYDVEKHLSAKYARGLIVALSEKPPTSAPRGPLRTIAELLFEVVTGKKDANLERHCKAELKAAASPKSHPQVSDAALAGTDIALCRRISVLTAFSRSGRNHSKHNWHKVIPNAQQQITRRSKAGSDESATHRH